MMYIYSLKSPVSKQKYPQRLAKFFAFAGLPQDISMEQQSELFVAKATAAAGPNWALKFVMGQPERVNRKEIVIATLRGYLKSIKTVLRRCRATYSMKEDNCGLPKGRKFADDRAPTIEEIRTPCKYPDRRITVIISKKNKSGYSILEHL